MAAYEALAAQAPRDMIDFSIRLFDDRVLLEVIDSSSKVPVNKGPVDAAVHEAEAVRGADDRIRGDINRRVVREGTLPGGEDVALADADSWHARECFLPGGCQGPAEVAKVNLEERHPVRISYLIPLMRA